MLLVFADTLLGRKPEAPDFLESRMQFNYGQVDADSGSNTASLLGLAI